MKKIYLLLIMFLFLTGCKNTSNPKTETSETEEQIYYSNPFERLDYNLPYLELDKVEYDMTDEIKVRVINANASDYVAIFDYNSEPGANTPHKKIKVTDKQEVVFSLANLELPAGEYAMCLYQNKTYYLLDRIEFQIDDIADDYQIQKAELVVEKTQKSTSTQVLITPSSDKELTYKGYWSKDGKRLTEYSALFRIKKGNSLETFAIKFNENLIMPNEANEIEIAVTEGKTSSYFIKVNDDLKIAKSKYLYNFQVLTDIHANPNERYGYWSSHFNRALLDIKCLAGNTSGIFTVGDNTDMGGTTDYDYLFSMINAVFPDEKPNIYYTVGNHDYMYSSDSVGGFERAIEYFKKATGMENSYYRVNVAGNNFIFLSSDTKTTNGSIGETQLNWFKSEMTKINKDEFCFIFVHQPFYNTTAGSLAGQSWSGMENAADEIKELLKSYPNAVMFTGHTHYTLDSYKATNFGHGENANYVHNGSIAYLWNNDYESQAGGQFNFIEVYEDYILIKGRDVLENKWVSSAQFICYLV